MKKKGIFLEIIIFITILASIFIIYYVYKELTSVTPENSNSNEIKNYSKDRKHKITKDITETSIYNIPESEYITEDSVYNYYINSTDGLIVSIDEEIIIKFNPYIDELTAEKLNETAIINYCNGYDEVTSDYILKCTYKNYTLNINNSFKLKNIFTDEIKTKKLTIPVSIKYEDRLDELLAKFDEQDIEYQEIQ